MYGEAVAVRGRRHPAAVGHSVRADYRATWYLRVDLSAMMDLRKAGLLKTKQGSAEPELAKQPEEISLYDIFAAVDMDHHLLHVDEDTEQKCPVGGNIHTSLAKAYAEVEEAAFAKMREISLQEIVDQIKEEGQLA